MTELIRISYTLRGIDYSALVTGPIARLIAADLTRRYEGRVAIEMERAS